MNVQQRNAQFLKFTKSIQPSQAQVGAVAEAQGCPNWVDGCCDAVGHPRSPSECYCANAVKALKSLENET